MDRLSGPPPGCQRKTQVIQSVRAFRVDADRLMEIMDGFIHAAIGAHQVIPDIVVRQIIVPGYRQRVTKQDFSISPMAQLIMWMLRLGRAMDGWLR